MDKVNFINGKWRLSAKARESGSFEYKDGDWFPKSKKKKKSQPKSTKTNKKMNCVGFPLGQIKEALKISLLYMLSGALGVSLAFNVVWCIEKTKLEQENLELLHLLNK